MQKTIALLFFLSNAGAALALDMSPWLDDVYEFILHSEVSYSHYRFIDGAVKQPEFSSNNYVIPVSIAFTVTPSLELEIEGVMAQTPNQSYGFRSSALGLRYRLYDDIAGDPLSITLGVSSRWVTGRSVRDVNSPYASYWNQEIALSLGKEFIKESDWKLRGHATGFFGIANHRSMWNRAFASIEGHLTDFHLLALFMDGCFGYGRQEQINIEHFRVWGTVHHGSLDLGLQYRMCFSLWGELGLSYAYRIYAKLYPQNVQTAQISYTLPFSLF